VYFFICINVCLGQETYGVRIHHLQTSCQVIVQKGRPLPIGRTGLSVRAGIARQCVNSIVYDARLKNVDDPRYVEAVAGCKHYTVFGGPGNNGPQTNVSGLLCLHVFPA
jgi:hypothetical protein